MTLIPLIIVTVTVGAIGIGFLFMANSHLQRKLSTIIKFYEFMLLTFVGSLFMVAFIILVNQLLNEVK